MLYLKTLLTFLFILISSSLHAQVRGDLNIVVLHSYNQENDWTEKIAKGFKSNIDSSKYGMVDFFTEYIDSKRFYGDDFDQSLKNLYSNKFKTLSVDLIATTDDYALDFALKYRKEIFNNAPIIFSGINGFDKRKRELYKRDKSFTGILSILDVKKNIELALRLQPNAKKIIFINTKHTPSGRYFKGQFEDGVKPFLSQYEVEYIEDLSFEELYKRCRNFKDDAVVFYGGYSRDRLNQHARFRDVISNISRNSTLPVYGFTDFYLNYGLAGGHVVSGFEQGKSMAKMANDYLSGKKVEDIPIIKNPQNPLILDSELLKKYNIDFKRIPSNARVIYHHGKLYNLYTSYKKEFWLTLLSFIVLLISSGVLYYFSIKQKEFKESLITLNNILEEKVQERTKQLIDQQSKLVNSARLATMGEMASGIAHEINNPLAIIDLTAGRVKQRTKVESNFKQINRINTTVSRISKIIKGLKHLSKDGEKSKKENFLLMESIEDVNSLCQERFKEYDITFNVEVDPELKVYGSLVQIGQMLLNLLNNSFDELISKKDNRWITLKAERVYLRDNKSYVEISITDSGKGIKKEDQSKLMDPFFTTKADKRGAGLGLTVCSNIISNYGGEFFYDAECENTRFVMRLPDLNDQQAVS